MAFKPNRKFKKKYDKIFKKDPLAANVLLLVFEIANEKGQVITDERQIADLMMVRFNDPWEYALGGMTNG